MLRRLFLVLLALVLGWSSGAAFLDHIGEDGPSEGRWSMAIVAGCRVLEGGEPSACLAARSRAAVDLYLGGRVDELLMTGGVGEHPPAEAEVAAALALAGGVPAAHISVETRSTSTTENAIRAREIAGDVDIIVVTDAYHAFRTRRVFGRHFTSVHTLGVRSPWTTRVRGAHREVAAVAWYALRGQL